MFLSCLAISVQSSLARLLESREERRKVLNTGLDYHCNLQCLLTSYIKYFNKDDRLLTSLDLLIVLYFDWAAADN